MTWNAPIPEVIQSISDSFLERSAPNVNGLFSGSALFLERNLVITILGSRLGFFCQTKANREDINLAWCEQLNSGLGQSGLISMSIVHIVSDRFPNWTENRSGIV